MDRRDFLKTMGLLAVTAPAGIAALKQIELEPEIDAAPFADLAESAGEAGAKLGEMAQCVDDCADALWQSVHSFEAAEAVAAGQYVSLCSGARVRASRSNETPLGIAVSDAGCGDNVGVVWHGWTTNRLLI